MDLIGYVHNLAEGVQEGMPTSEELQQLFKAYINRKASKERIQDLRARLLTKSKQFLRDTIRMHKMLDDEDTVETLNRLAQVDKPPRWWAGRGLNVELLRSAVRQLEAANTAADILLAIYRLISVVEDTSGPVVVGHLNGRGLNLYHYLMQIQDWSPQRREAFSDMLELLTDKVLQRIANRAERPARARRPMKRSIASIW